MKRILLALSLAVAPAVQAADDLDTLGALSQSQFKDLSEDLGAALSYKALAPAEPLGITGFDIGLEMTATGLENDEAFDLACDGCDVSTLVIPKLHLHKGLPLAMDVGLSYGEVPGSNIRLLGAEWRYAMIEGNVAVPAVAVRVTYSRLDGVEQLDMTNTGVELTVSKGLAMLTPYAGIGQVWTFSKPDGGTGLDDEELTLTKYFLGANLNFGLLNFAIEADQTGGASSYGAKIGFRF